jgi:hypothetical protein
MCTTVYIVTTMGRLLRQGIRKGVLEREPLATQYMVENQPQCEPRATQYILQRQYMECVTSNV